MKLITQQTWLHFLSFMSDMIAFHVFTKNTQKSILEPVVKVSEPSLWLQLKANLSKKLANMGLNR